MPSEVGGQGDLTSDGLLGELYVCCVHLGTSRKDSLFPTGAAREAMPGLLYLP